MIVRVLVLSALAFAALTASAGADPRIVRIGFDAAGDPLLNAHVAWPEMRDVREWRRCPPDGSACVPLPASAYQAGAANSRLEHHGGFLPAAPGETPAGTTFEAVFEIDGNTTTLPTPPWTGRIALSGLPAVAGEAAIGSKPLVQAAPWSGGWAGGAPRGTDMFGTLLACPTPTGGECWSLVHPLRPRYAGWFLFARWTLSWRDPDGPVAALAPPVERPVTIGPAGAIPPPGTIRELAATSNAISPICCVLPPAGLPLGLPAASPRATILTRAKRRGRQVTVGHVSCAKRCVVRVRVRGGGRSAVERTSSGQGRIALTIPARRGRLSVRVTVDGTVVARGMTTAR